MGNAILPFIHENVKFDDFFNNGEIITYRDEKDLLSKLISIKDNEKLLKKNSLNAKRSYFAYFENTIIADSIINKVFNTKKNFKYIWKN